MSTPIPRFRLWPVLLWGQLLYLVMAAFFGLFFLASDMLEHQARPLSPPPGEGSFLWFPWVGLVVACGAVLLWHRPLAQVFRALRAGKPPSAQVLGLARKRVFHSPFVVGVGVPVAVGGVEVGLALLGMHSELRVLPINLLFLVLTGFFTFFGNATAFKPATWHRCSPRPSWPRACRPRVTTPLATRWDCSQSCRRSFP